MIIGIDLGTTFSVAAYIDSSGNPHVVNSREGGNTTPSVVLFEDGEVIIGKQAKDNAELSPENVVQFVKRFMGNKEYSFLAENGKEYSAEEISSMILRRIKEDSETCIGEPITEAVITVPAYFTDAQRKSTIDAGKIAGLNVLSLLNEPTAAALAYGFSNLGKQQRIMVYDIGGGTFDVSIIEIRPDKTIEVLASHGNRNLGGMDFDNKLISYARKCFEDKTGIDLEDDDEAMQILRARCEQAKVALSGSDKAIVTISSHGKKEKIEITRELFEEFITPLIEETEVDIDIALEDSRLTPADIDKVLLVGGSSRIPLIREFVKKKLNIVPSAELNPDEVVAIGAAFFATTLKTVPSENGEQKGSAPAEKQKIVKDVNSHGLGVIALTENQEEKNFVIVKRNQPIPTIGYQEFCTVVDNQESVYLRITEGDDNDVEYVTVIGEALINLPSHPAGSPITIELSYDENGIITGRVFDQTTMQYVGDVVINRSANMTSEEVEESARRMEDETFA